MMFVQCEGNFNLEGKYSCGSNTELGDETVFMRTLEVTVSDGPSSGVLHSISFDCEREQTVTVVVQTRLSRMERSANLLMYMDSRTESSFPHIADNGKTSSLPTSVGVGEHLVTVEGNDIASVTLLSDSCRILEESHSAVDVVVEQPQHLLDAANLESASEFRSASSVDGDVEDHRVSPVQGVLSQSAADDDQMSIVVHGGLSRNEPQSSTDSRSSFVDRVPDSGRSEQMGGNWTRFRSTDQEVLVPTNSDDGNVSLLVENESDAAVYSNQKASATVLHDWSGGGLVKASFAVAFALPFVVMWLAVFMLICWCTDRNSGDKKDSSETATSCGSMTPGSRTTMSGKRLPVGGAPVSPISPRSVRGLYTPFFETSSSVTNDLSSVLCPELTLTEGSEVTVLMPSLWPHVGELTVHAILDSDENALMQVSITSTPMTAAKGAYSEYVLLSQRNEREVGFCEVTVQKTSAGQSANGLLYRWNGHLFAKLTERPSNRLSRQRTFVVQTVAKGAHQQHMIITGDFLTREVQAMNTADDTALAVSSAREGVSSVVDEYYRLLLHRNSDAGLVILSLLVIDRILQPSWGSKPKNGGPAPASLPTVLPTVLPRPPSFSVDPSVFLQ